MDCRTARTLLDRPELGNADAERLAQHMATCAACQDDAADPIGQLLRQIDLPLAHPPPSFTEQVMLRLPAAAPEQLHRMATRAQVRRTRLTLAGLMLSVLAFVVLVTRFGVTSQPSAALIAPFGGVGSALGSSLLRLALVAKALLLLRNLPVAVLLLAAAELLRRWWPSWRQRLSGRPALGMTTLALALVLVVLGQLTAGNMGPHALTDPVVITAPVNGDVVALAGNVTVASHVSGDVVSLFGQVNVAPSGAVDGSVLTGGGNLAPNHGPIAGGVVDGLGPLPLAAVSPDTTTSPMRPIARLAGILGALITLAIAGLWVMLQPHRVRSAGDQLQAHPAQALLIGLALCIVLLGLALGGTMVLAATVVGVILIPVLLVMAHLPFIQGIAAVGQLLGERVASGRGPLNVMWGIGVEAVLLMGLALLTPLGSLVAFYLLGSLGLGASLLDLQKPRLGID